MKKLVWILVALVIVLGGLLISEYMKDDREEAKEKGEAATVVAKEVGKSTEDNETYHFQDIENMEKATSINEAFVRIFGKDRLFDDFKDSDSYSDYESSNFKDPYNGDIKYYLSGVYDSDNIPSDDRFTYFPEKQYFFESMFIGISLKPGFDTRMEMIDFLHYLQYSGLTNHQFIKEALSEDSVKVYNIYPTEPEEKKPFTINMEVYQQIKPGMNMPESHQGWSISSDIIEAMDFSDKESILNSIHMYGKFEGVNPSGMK
ncbi:hypothetical protein MZM54_03640 [[Brevibacterium] frigoritolerans]|nr:hypothetical protein [Peribacillus frigoritolerans]